MLEFISKLQFKTYEKGEFSDEKPRNLEETLQLINDFPWDQQRGVDVQPTGPSVTIQDEYVNYLKVGLYFNGKFCLYYLDNDNHLYEYHVETIDAVYKLVTDFLNQQLDLEQFEKHSFSIGSKAHFETAYFEYRVNKVKIAINFILIVFLSIISFGGLFASFKIPGAPIFLPVLDIFLSVLCVQALYFMIKVYLKSKDMYLQLSSGNDSFQFGVNDDNIQIYNKKNISTINIYGASSRSSSIFKIIEITFNDNSIIAFSGLLIDVYSFTAKFPGSKIDWMTKTSTTWKAIWNFSK